MIYETVTSELRARFQRARRVAVLTGAGVSAESGVPIFRGGGHSLVWQGYPFEQLSSEEMLIANPVLVWQWFNYRREIISQVQPNPAHKAIAEWQTKFAAFTLVTQNIDDLHRVAGSTDVLELHGNIWRVRCQTCDRVSEYREVPIREYPPLCSCRGILRPDVVLFGEALPQPVWQRAYEEAVCCDFFLVVGTSAVVSPAAKLPLVARRNGAFLAEVNPEVTPLTSLADVTLFGKAGEIVPAFTDAQLAESGERRES